MGEDKYGVPILDRKNCQEWKFRMEGILEELDLLPHITRDLSELVEVHTVKEDDSESTKKQKEDSRAVLTKADRKCKNHIVAKVHGDLLEVVRDKRTAYAMWHVLQDRFESKTITAQVNLQKQLINLRYQPRKDTFQNHCSRFDRLVRELGQAGDRMDSRRIVVQFLLTLPQEYESITSSPQTSITRDSTVDMVKNHIEEYEQRMQAAGAAPKHIQPVAFLGERQDHPEEDAASFPYSCENCGRRGH